MRKAIVKGRRRGLELGRVAHQHSHSQPHSPQTQIGVMHEMTVRGADTGGAAAGIGSGAVVTTELRCAIHQMEIAPAPFNPCQYICISMPHR